MEIAIVCFGTFCVTLSCIYFTELSTWLRNKIHKKVQCWFCHVGSRVKYIDSNSWTCPSCGQYNGFTKDGDYNRDIPSQYDDRLNINCNVFHRPKSNFRRENALCSQCNYNQELKIKQLAAFVPINESKYDKEIDHYRLQLEESYKLCQKCEKLVANVISSQRYILPGPRRLAHLTKRLIFKSCWTLYLSMILTLLVIMNRVPSVVSLPEEWLLWMGGELEYLAQPLTCQILAGLGVVLHTLQCCQFGTYWSFVNWLVWACLASSPHFLHNQLPQHVSYIQMAISLSLFISTLIIVVRKKRHEQAAKMKEHLRTERRRKEDSTATWTSSTSQSNGCSGSPGKSKKASPTKVPSSSPKSVTKPPGKANLLKPVARVPDVEQTHDDLDISNLSIGSKYDNPFAKAAYSPSPWDRVTITRRSNCPTGMSSLRGSPLGWKPNQTLQTPLETSFTKQPHRSSPMTMLNEHDWTRSATLNSLKEPNFRRPSDSWTPVPRNQWDVSGSFDQSPDWEMKKTQWPMQVYSYPVAYAWPGVTTPWNQSTGSAPSVRTSSPTQEAINKTNGSFLNSLPTAILAATNAILVYYILYSKS